MNKEDFVSLEMAKILKDKGFDSPILYECWKPIPSFDEIIEANRDVLNWLKDK